MVEVIAYIRWMFLVFSVVNAQGFTYPTSQVGFVVGDLVNITWNVPAARFSLYELCQTAIILESNSTNNFSSVWNATLDHYQETGCVFELEPLYGDGTPLLPNYTTPDFAVGRRDPGDSAPTDWNFGGSQSTSTTSSSSPSTSTSTSTRSSTSTPSSLPTSTSPSTSISTPSIAPASNTSAISSAQPWSGLSSSRKGGIGVGISFGFLLLCALCFLLLWYKRGRRDRHAGDGGEMEQQRSAITSPTFTNDHFSGTETLISELSSQNHDDHIGPISELMGTPRAEME